MTVEESIVCVECGGRARLLQDVEPGEEWEPGDVASYRCGDCGERLDVVVEEDDTEAGRPVPPPTRAD